MLINEPIHLFATGVEGSPANNGMLCVKGRYGYDFVNDPNRLRNPLIKEEGKFREASWEEAITLVANKFMEIKKEHGADSIGGLCSAKVTNEDNYVFMKFMRKEIGTNNVDHCAGFAIHQQWPVWLLHLEAVQ